MSIHWLVYISTKLVAASVTTVSKMAPTTPLLSGWIKRGFWIFKPDLSTRLLPAQISTFFPEILMSPLGALMVMPVKASMLTSPNGDLTLIFRS